MTVDLGSHSSPSGLQPNERLYRLLARNIPNGTIFLFDQDLRYTFAEGQGLALTNLSPEQFIGKTLRDIFPPEVYQRDEPILRAALEGHATTVEVEYGGRHFWVQTLPIRDDTGAILGGVVFSQDITDLKQTETLRREQNRFKEMVANIPAMLFRFRVTEDSTLKLEYISPRCQELNGFDAETAMQNPQLLTDPIKPDDQKEFWARINEAISTNRVFTWEGQIMLNGQLRWRKYEAYPTPQTDGTIVWNGLQTDTTHEKQTEAILLETERLETAFQKEQELGMLKTRMMQRISHEFRTPLSLVMTASSMMERYHNRINKDQREAYLQQITGQVEHLTHILDEIDLVMNGIFQETTFEPRMLDLEAITVEEINRFQMASQTPMLFNRTLPDNLPTIVADEKQLRAVLSNVLSNAVKFSPPDQPIWVNISQEDDAVILEVRDEGIGIPDEDQERLFEPFHRGSNIGEIPGLGLGLNIIKSAVELHGGTITIQSMIGQGTTVTIYLPLQPAETSP